MAKIKGDTGPPQEIQPEDTAILHCGEPNFVAEGPSGICDPQLAPTFHGCLLSRDRFQLNRCRSDSVSPVSYCLVKDIRTNDSDGGAGVDEAHAGDPLNEDRSTQEGPVTSAAHHTGLA